MSIGRVRRLRMSGLLFGLLIMPSLLSSAMAGDFAWPEQSRAERLGTRAYIFGSMGLGYYDVPEIVQQRFSDTADDSDVLLRGGFGYRLNSHFSVELAMIDLGSPYQLSRPPSRGSDTLVTQTGQTIAHEASLLGRIALKGMPPLTKATLRLGTASLDTVTHNDTALVSGFGIEHEPFRIEWSHYDFDHLSIKALMLTYIYDF